MQTLNELLSTNNKYLKILKENWINTIKDFFQYFPRSYEDRDKIKKINNIDISWKTTSSIKCKISDKKLLKRWKHKIYETEITDIDWQKAYITFFNSYYQTQKLEQEKRYIITWKWKLEYNKIISNHPDIQNTEWPDLSDKDLEKHNLWRIFPIYPELKWIKPNRFAKKMRDNMDKIKEYFSEYLPDEVMKNFNLKWTIETISDMHYPNNFEEQKKSLDRIFFDRLLRIQLFSIINKQKYLLWSNLSNEKSINRELVKDIIKLLPFELTNSQKKCIKDIIEDIHLDKPMMRLLQWDVWSWKTIVSIIAIYYIIKLFWWQAVFLVPLEVLSNQHHKSIAKILLPLWIRIEILKGSLNKSQKDKIKSNIRDWKIDVVIWTHAIIQEDVEFKNLQIVVIDEQHKFWVKQRSFFKKFGSPHILQMSATPIPRSMALAFFWEFSISTINELPKWRKPIHTKIISEKERIKIKTRVLNKIEQWQKVFIITPLIEESEKIENVKAAITEFENIKNLYNEISDNVWILHWKMNTKDKERIMKSFKEWIIKILVSTTVIEVWIDIPEATIMIIKNAERFWLSQLHQLRWRVWRSNIQSYCFLETKSRSSDSYKRLKAMEETNDWFKLAELDLQNRWAWEILWIKQSGETDIPLEILYDISFIENVQRVSLFIIDKYPQLNEIPQLKKYLEEKIWNLLV